MADGSTRSFFLVAVHGGAGIHDESKTSERDIKNTMKNACVRALDALQHGGAALQAVEHAIIALEDSECLNAGYGSNLTLEGTAECDASIMDDTGDFGGVGAVSGAYSPLRTIRITVGTCPRDDFQSVKNPIAAARSVLEHSKTQDRLGRIPPILLVSEGARTFAERHGVKCLLHESLICPRALEEWRKWKRQLDNYGGDDIPDTQELSRIQDTVGAISWDSCGGAAAGVSSGGLLLKFPGRVGEAAIFSAGCWAQRSSRGTSIACSVSGSGEYILRVGLARAICEAIVGDPDADTHEVVHDQLSRFYNMSVARGEPEPNAGIILGVRDEGDDDDERAQPRLWCAFTAQSMAIAYASSLDPKPQARILRRPAQGRQAGATIYITALSLTR